MSFPVVPVEVLVFDPLVGPLHLGWGLDHCSGQLPHRLSFLFPSLMYTVVQLFEGQAPLLFARLLQIC